MEPGRAYFKNYRALLIIVMMFKWGIFCVTKADLCVSSPCQNGGTCITAGTNYSCLCPNTPPLYVGKNCENLYNACKHVNCSNCITTPGTDTYFCPCSHGAGGPACNKTISHCESNPCTGVKSLCVDGLYEYSCKCPKGFSGEDCQMRMEDCSGDPCKNNGTCVWLPSGYRCQCASGFQGKNCEHDIDECQSQPCQNGAICVEGPDLYTCYCVPGYQGYNCEIDINECASQPCENNATCINGKDRYICECLLGFTGVNCEVEIDECEVAPCKNNATCHDHVGWYTCECVPGFTGKDCEVDIDECAIGPCLNNGSCVDMVNGYVCDCHGTGFTGSVCEEDVPECESNPCQHGSTCVEGTNQYSCQCWPGYKGENCEVDVDECEAQPCHNGGQCFQRSDQNLYGVLAQLDADFIYEHAAGFLCQCLPGFTGDNCSVNVDECESMPCQNGGRCEDLINGYQCFCPLGFTGILCEVNIDECESAPCQNGASCQDDINDYVCHCPDPSTDQLPWGGQNCDIPLTACIHNPCQNGGTCKPLLQDNRHTYNCYCPPGFYSKNCTISTTFSFLKADFVVVDAPLYELMSFNIRFRTTLPDGVLFFRGDIECFLMMELKDGGLFVVAESGRSVMKVQFEGHLNDGQWHDVKVSLDTKLVMVLDKYANIEDGGHNELILFSHHNMSRTYFGGVPFPEYLNKTKSRTGFIGCMEDVFIDLNAITPQDFFKELTSNVQLGCEKPDWCKPASCSQQGNCVDLWTEYRCDCSRPFYGNICQHEHTLWTFGHENSRSFAAFPITRSYDGNFSVSFFLRSLKRDGLVLQLKRGRQAYFTIFLKKGALNVAVHSLVNGSSVFVTDGQRLLISIDVHKGSVSFNDTETLIAVTEVEVEAGDTAYVGGLPETEDTLQWGGHFKGCLQDVRLAETLLYINKELWKSELTSVSTAASFHNVLENCITDQMCKDNPCLNGGKCEIRWNDFNCSCPMNYTGKTCNTRLWCVSDPCMRGSQCVNLPDGYECLTNATFENNALEYSAIGSLSSSVSSVSINLRTRAKSATLLRTAKGSEFFCIGLLNSLVFIKIHTSSSPELLAFTSRVKVSDGAWHRVELSKAYPSHSTAPWQIVVDGQVASINQVFDANLDFFNHSVVWLAENFTGCLGEVRIGGVYLPLNSGVQEEVPQFSKFARVGGTREPQFGCRGAPVCQLQPCLNNGSCQDLFNTYSCDCPPGWEGEICQDDIDECVSGPCVHGKCRNLPGEYQCQCARGYTGKRCDEDVDECQESPCQNRGSCVNRVGGYTCVCPPGYSGPLCQWSFPPLQCGTDVHCANGGKCIDGVWGANCTCVQGYTGDRCEMNINECESNPCLNGGTCMDQQNHYLCKCLPGFSGESCETTRQQQQSVPWLVVAIPLMCFGALLAVVGMVCMVLTARRKRQCEGTYSPSQQEVAGARMEMGSVLKVPPEERLI